MTRMTRSQRIITGLVSLRAVLQGVESVLIDLLAIFTPWLAPIIPASMTYRNMITELGFDPAIAFIGAMAVEFLGLAAINTAVEFWQYNEDKSARREARISGMSAEQQAKAKQRKTIGGAPILPAIVTGAFYVSIVVTVNAILEVGQIDGVHIVAKILLCLLSVVSGVIIALRASHTRRLNPIRVQRVQPESEPESDRTPTDEAESEPESRPTITYEEYAALNAARNGQGPMSAGELLKTYNISHSTAYQWQGDYRESIGLDRRTGRKQERTAA